MLSQVELQDSEESRKGDSYIAANGSRMPNLGEKKVRFLTKEGIEPSVLFQVTDQRKNIRRSSRMAAGLFSTPNNPQDKPH